MKHASLKQPFLKYRYIQAWCIKRFSPNGDQHQISLYHFSALIKIHVMRIREMITNDELS